MAPAARKPGAQTTPAEVALVHLKNCLVNLPSSLVSVLVNANTLAQDVVIELTYRPPPITLDKSTTANGTGTQKSAFVGWTGMPSKRKLAPVIGSGATKGNAAGREQEVAVVEIDAAFGRVLGLTDLQKVGVILHLEPPLAHTVNIEPSTPADWESKYPHSPEGFIVSRDTENLFLVVIELHATFLELNFLAQIRALPNPSYSPSSAAPPEPSHPLTLHLSPTSTANIIVTSITPAPLSSSSFVKIAPDAEVIVAPKTRPRSSRNGGRETRSVASAGRKSLGGRSGASTVRQKSHRDDASSRGALFFRGVDRAIEGEWFDDVEEMGNEGLRVWVHRDVLASKSLRGTTWVCVTVVKPAGLQGPIDPQKHGQHGKEETGAAGDVGKPTVKLVARIGAWDDAPDSQHIALSSSLCACMSSARIVGGIVRVEAAPQQVPKNTVKTLKVFPFALSTSKKSEGLKFGGESKVEKEEAARKIKSMYGKKDGILEGPLTDGMVLCADGSFADQLGWEGGLIRFDPSIAESTESGKILWGWLVGSERKLNIEVQPEIPRLPNLFKSIDMVAEPIPVHKPAMVGIDFLIKQLTSHLSHSSSVLLTGGLGSGKTSLTHLLAHRLRNEYLFHTAYFPCRKLVTDETRVSTIKQMLNRVFMSASWGARLGGRSVVILDDIDKLCPVETELQVGGENGRSRQISEGVCSIVKEYCDMDSGIVLLVTAQGKESLNNVVVGGHVVREIVSLKAPDKEGRRRVLEMLLNNIDDTKTHESHTQGQAISGSKGDDDGAWMDGTISSSRPGSSAGVDGFVVAHDLDFLDLAGHTDGYMPGDLVLLASRARSEALIRSVELDPNNAEVSTIHIGKEDFTKALKDFTPASLRNVTLQSSTTTFASIGGLHETRKILLETLQYPTTYAPIFAQCPLRLRSGLLLYGYPGCGKTLLASAVAGECGLNFISVKGPEILNKYIGASEKSVRDLFERAEAARPGHDSTGVTDRVVNQMLTQMDGAEGLSGVYVLAATSRPDLIDPALLRPGRLDKSLICDLPSYNDRVDILQALAKKLKMSEVLENKEQDYGDGGSLREVARRTEGYSGADLQAVVYNAHLEAIHDLLGDHDHENDGRNNGNASQKSRQDSKSSSNRQRVDSRDFIQFRFGEEEDRKDIEALATSGQNRSKQLAERAAIAAKLDAIKTARRRQRRQQRGEISKDDDPAGISNNRKDKHEQQEVVIAWKHIMASLAMTRSSISPEERKRLAGIYREFVVGRNGEMPSGQGPTEVGGRSSLM
ncbi:MAG: Peroxisome biosynthesis protein pex1 [Pycnora praestabilis]|nr:MAG: Peroxisome biosynthesis protein pex1 [Pycnora praestabilis]